MFPTLIHYHRDHSNLGEKCSQWPKGIVFSGLQRKWSVYNTNLSTSSIIYFSQQFLSQSRQGSFTMPEKKKKVWKISMALYYSSLLIALFITHATCLVRMDWEDGSDHGRGCILTYASANRGKSMVIWALNQEFTPRSGMSPPPRQYWSNEMSKTVWSTSRRAVTYNPPTTSRKSKTRISVNHLNHDQ